MCTTVGTKNCLTKHIEDSRQVYVILNELLEASETVSTIVSITPSDSAITTSSSSIIQVTTTKTFETVAIDGTTSEVTFTFEAGKVVVFTVSGGTSGAGVTYITVKFTTSAGNTLAVDCSLKVSGIDV